MKHLRVLGMTAVLAGSLGFASAASAAPIGVGTLGSSERSASVELVAGGCGPGWHPNPWGECRPNRRPPPYWGDGYGYRRPPPPPPPEYGYGGYGGPRRFYY
ncbi:GCG_CRPN prefix-to-repeats domain-containing protein [Methylobacterium sp. J-068]|uniref:GCG_CRPN prefix-to-repeats domain-containing protein n=1 Tax=Methylobacterium sp. J-068 TaxID=2836649 RepID=UPI003919629F